MFTSLLKQHTRASILSLAILVVAVGLLESMIYGEFAPSKSRKKAFDVEELQSRIFKTIKKTSPSVVLIEGGRGGAFSGVLVSTEGHVLSAGHAVQPDRSYQVRLSDGRTMQARGMGTSRCLDCGLIKILDGKDIPFAEMVDSSRIRRNQPCLSVSYPSGSAELKQPVLRFGRIVRPASGVGMIQSTALMEPGDSGGPLFDLDGGLIAIHSRIGRSTLRNYEVPVNLYKDNWEQLNKAKLFCGHPGHINGHNRTRNDVKGKDESIPEAEVIPELASLPRQFSDLEKRLDDHCVVVTSSLEKKHSRVYATLISSSRDIISKSSMVGDDPSITLGGRRRKLEVIARDPTNDLVLLRAPKMNPSGIVFLDSQTTKPALGTLLMTPDPVGYGFVSIRSSVEFVSKDENFGFLGVIPSEYRDGGALINVQRKSAAADAGLKTGDIIVKLDSIEIETARELREFLSETYPGQKVEAVVIRRKERLSKIVTLGSRPVFKGHVSDYIKKSERRGGFDKVFSHDADLRPAQCGGPVYDLAGRFVGLNISRYSRVRSFVIPAEEIRAFVERSSSARREAIAIATRYGSKSLPDLSTLSKDIDYKKLDGNSVLLCMVDIAQRHSRRCLYELAQKREYLAFKGLTLVVVQVSRTDQTPYAAFLKAVRFDIPIPMVDQDFEIKKIEWGVKDLPWLILTDKAHVVVGEGRSVAEVLK